MTCAEFEGLFDQYVDETLDAASMNSCSCHIAKCRPCDREVTRWQQTRILLSTAVADFSTAVDVSSVRNDVFAALGFAEDDATKRRSEQREAAYDRGASRRSAGRSSRRAASGERRGAFHAVVRFASAATASAVAAAAAVMLLTPAPQTVQTTSTPQVASVSKGTTSSPVRNVRAAKWNGFRNQFDVAPVAYARPPLARPEPSHVDGLEAAPGQQAATWVQPRTGARVIWVENRGLGAPVRMAGLAK